MELEMTYMVVAILLGLFVKLYNGVVVKPWRLRSVMAKQGMEGPSPSFLLGNIVEINNSSSESGKLKFPAGEAPASHRCASLFFPFFDKWRKIYGDMFVFSILNTQILYVSRAEVVREIATCTDMDLGKPLFQSTELDPILGQGIVTSNGPAWAHQRKIIAPQLYMDKVKGMIDLIIESSNVVLESWKKKIESEGGVADIKIDNYMRSFSADVISKACFGSNFLKRQEIFTKIRDLQDVTAKAGFFIGVHIPGLRLIPTKNHREAWALEKEVRRLILNEVKERKEGPYEDDLLQMVIEGARNINLGADAADRFIVDNCKNIYYTGHEPTWVTITWCLMLLASNQEWQARAREEVLEICKGQLPDSNMLREMKQVTMVIQETLRLYPPVAMIAREAHKDMKLGDIHVPKGLNIWTCIPALHTDTEVWGQDAHKFNPQRFENGVTGACKMPHLYMPFGIGPKMCLGQNLAMTELKIMLALVLSNFAFSISPAYQHAPSLKPVLEPGNGVQLLLKKLE